MNSQIIPLLFCSDPMSTMEDTAKGRGFAGQSNAASGAASKINFNLFPQIRARDKSASSSFPMLCTLLTPTLVRMPRVLFDAIAPPCSGSVGQSSIVSDWR